MPQPIVSDQGPSRARGQLCGQRRLGRSWAALALTAILLAGCGGGGDEESDSLSPSEAVDLLMTPGEAEAICQARQAADALGVAAPALDYSGFLDTYRSELGDAVAAGDAPPPREVYDELIGRCEGP